MHTSILLASLLGVGFADAACSSTPRCGLTGDAKSTAGLIAQINAVPEAYCLASCATTPGCQSIVYAYTGKGLNTGAEPGFCYQFNKCVDDVRNPSDIIWRFYDHNCPPIIPQLPATCSKQMCNQRGLPNHNVPPQTTITELSELQCLQRCQTSSWCNSISYYLANGAIGTSGGLCSLYETCSAVAMGTSGSASDTETFYDKSCPDEVGPPTDPSCSVFVGTCHQQGQYLIYKGNYDQLSASNEAACHQLCVNDSECRSSGFLHTGSNAGQCFLSSVCSADAFPTPGGGPNAYPLIISDKLCS